MIVKEASVDDIDHIVELNRSQYDDVDWDKTTMDVRWEIDQWGSDPDLFRWYHSILVKSGGGSKIAIADAKIVGILDYCKSWDHIPGFRGERIHIIWLFTHPEFRRRGIAKQLLSSICDESDVPVWVEPEDERSLTLYSVLGKPIHYISNWQINIEQITPFFLDNRISFQIGNFDNLHNIGSDYYWLLGRYYAPSYDINQLQYSEPVHKYMWHHTPAGLIYIYEINQTKVIMIATQYPRYFVSKTYNLEDLKMIIASSCLDIFELGFDDIYLQNFSDDGLAQILSELQFERVIESDPVFQLC